MGRRSQFSQDQINAMRDLRRQGAKLSTIAQVLGITPQAVAYWCDDEVRTRMRATARKNYITKKLPEPIQITAPKPAPAAPGRDPHAWLSRWLADA